MKTKVPFREIVDLSHDFFVGMPNIAGLAVNFWSVETIVHSRKVSSGKLGIESKMILMPEHCGTHFDAPRHFDLDGLTVDQVPLTQTVLPGNLLDLTHRKKGEAITPDDLMRAEEKSGTEIGPGTATVVWCGVEDNWGKPNFHIERPFIPVPTAEWLVERKITLFCTDLIGMDDPAEWWWPTHEIWLKNGICMVQQLCNLGKLVAVSYTHLTLPTIYSV